MNFLKRALWTALAAVALAGTASAQGLGGTGGTGGLGGLGGGTGGLGSLLGNLGGGGQGGQGLGGQGAAGGQGVAQGVNLAPPSQTAQAPQSVATSNNIGKFYAEPLFQGRATAINTPATNLQIVNPGGFGAPLYGASLGAPTTGVGGAVGGGTNSRSFGTTGFGGTQAGVGGGGFGAAGGANARGAAGAGGMAGAGGLTNQTQGIAVQGTPAIAYTATVKFNARTVTPAQVQSELQTILNRTSNLSNAAGIQLTADANGAVALRGQVRDADEARLVEGLVRSTPGVRFVDNGLQFPKQ